MKYIKSTERLLQKQFKLILDDPVSTKLKLPPKVTVVDQEVPIYNAASVLTYGTCLSSLEIPLKDETIGRIDVVFRHNGFYYVVEIKDSSSVHQSFWYSTKALAYCEYYKWQTGNSGYRPAVLIPKASLKLENQIVAEKLKIRVYLYEKKGDTFFIELASSRNLWSK